MKKATLTLTARTPLLMHADNIEFADLMEAWKNNPANKAKSKAGDDRTPPWRWLGCLNYDEPKAGVITIPSEYIMRSIMGGAAEVPTGKGKKTFKALSQSGMVCEQFHFPLLIKGKPISMKDINECKDLETFKENADAAQMMGFSLYVKRARIGAAKHIRVRPRFDDWSIRGDILITEEQITKEVLQNIFDIAGRTKGLADWRPGSPTPGSWGMYECAIDAWTSA